MENIGFPLPVEELYAHLASAMKMLLGLGSQQGWCPCFLFRPRDRKKEEYKIPGSKKSHKTVDLCSPVNMILSLLGTGSCVLWPVVAGPGHGWAALGLSRAEQGLHRLPMAKCPLPSLTELQLCECPQGSGWEPQVVPDGRTSPAGINAVGQLWTLPWKQTEGSRCRSEKKP